VVPPYWAPQGLYIAMKACPNYWAPPGSNRVVSARQEEGAEGLKPEQVQRLMELVILLAAPHFAREFCQPVADLHPEVSARRRFPHPVIMVMILMMIIVIIIIIIVLSFCLFCPR
jgi:hypothetical protein